MIAHTPAIQTPMFQQGVFTMKQQLIITALALVASSATIAATGSPSGSHDINLVVDTGSQLPVVSATPTLGDLLSGAPTNLSTSVDASSNRKLNNANLGSIQFSATNLSTTTPCTVTFTSQNSTSNLFKLRRAGGMAGNAADEISYTLSGRIDGSSGSYTFTSGQPKTLTNKPDPATQKNRCDMSVEDLTVASGANLNNIADGTYSDTIAYVIEVN